MTTGERNLMDMFRKADAIDLAEGKLAYQRYNQVMRWLAEEYGNTLPRTLAVFCALSPNNDYFGNLRSAASVLAGVRDGVNCEQITVSTYKHCRNRAYLYATGEADFLVRVKGLKIRSFYQNILNPDDDQPVTIDGHMKAAFVGKNLTMKEAIVGSKREYNAIADAARFLSGKLALLPHQFQAIVWFARKRTLRIKYNPQLSLFGRPDDVWATLVTPDQVPPYPFLGEAA